MPKLKITETILRDGQQSLALSRMTTEEMLPILPVLDRVGYHALEVFGGATFDVCLRYLDEDPWSRLKTLRSNLPSTSLQMVMRGQSAVGYRHQPDDIVQSFVQRCAANGINIMRVYDALNDYRNLETAISTARREGLTVSAAICYTESPVYTTEHFVSCAKAYVDLGAENICIKDMAGVLRPYEAYQIIKALRAELPAVPLELHTHTTAGFAAMTLLKAVEIGVEYIDPALSPFAEGASLPATEAVVSAFTNTPYVPTLDAAALKEAEEYFSTVRARYLKEGIISPDTLRASPGVSAHGFPTGTYSVLFEQLCRADATDRVKEVYEEIVRVRADAGYAPLVSPVSQIIATQALRNVLDGDRYKTVTEDFRDLCAGKYGRLPAPLEPIFAKQILGDALPLSCRPADKLKNAVEKYRHLVAPYAEQDEDYLTLAMFEDVARHYFERRKMQKYHLDFAASSAYPVHPV